MTLIKARLGCALNADFRTQSRVYPPPMSVDSAVARIGRGTSNALASDMYPE